MKYICNWFSTSRKWIKLNFIKRYFLFYEIKFDDNFKINFSVYIDWNIRCKRSKNNSVKKHIDWDFNLDKSWTEIWSKKREQIKKEIEKIYLKKDWYIVANFIQN